jgi:virginiamycin B lyase
MKEDARIVWRFRGGGRPRHGRGEFWGMRQRIVPLLLLLISAGTACGRGFEAESGGVTKSVPASDVRAPGGGLPPFVPGPPPPPAPTGGFGPVQVTPTREQAQVSPPPAVAGGAGAADCWDAPVLTEYTLTTAGGRPRSVAEAADGSVWFSDAASIGRLEPSGAVTRYPLPAGRTPGSIAVDTDGSVWFATTGPAIAHLKRSGRLVGYAVPTTQPNPMGGNPDTVPIALTAGPDRAIWFLEAGADQVGRITPDGVITEYPLPNRDRMHANPEGMAAGLDKAMWFSEPLTMRVGRIDVHTFAITEFPIPPAPNGVGAATMTAGLDGAVWFEGGGGAVGRVATNGDMTMFPLPWQGQYAPNSVTAGPDSRIWLLDSRNGKVLRMTLQGEVSELPPVADPKGLYASGLDQMTSGPDAVWFAESALNRIGRFACRQAVPSGAV